MRIVTGIIEKITVLLGIGRGIGIGMPRRKTKRPRREHDTVTISAEARRLFLAEIGGHETEGMEK